MSRCERFGRRLLLLAPLAFPTLTGPARAARPPAAIVEERRELDAEIEMLHRKTDSLERSLRDRREKAKARVRALYKLSRGGYVELLVSAETASDFFLRRDAVSRVVRRDLDELKAIADELDELKGDRDRLRERERRALELAAEGAPLVATQQGDSALQQGNGATQQPHGASQQTLAAAQQVVTPTGAPIVPPVAGAIVGRFGLVRDPAIGLETSRDGVELRAQPGETVRAIAQGVVRSVGPLPGLGLSVIVDHGGGWVSLTARLAHAPLAPGESVAAGGSLGVAAGSTVQLQVAQGGTWIDPAPLLGAARPTKGTRAPVRASLRPNGRLPAPSLRTASASPLPTTRSSSTIDARR